MSSAVDGVASTGPVKVPVTTDAANPYKDLEAIKTINRNFTADQVEKDVFDPRVELASAARLLTEYRCWGSWKRQHDFYRRVVREHSCAYLRYRAAQLLEYDICTPATVDVLINEYDHTAYPEIREYIARKLGMSRDKRAVALVETALKSPIKTLSQAAAEGKAYGASQSCAPQDAMGKPYYGYMDVADVCEGTEGGTNMLGQTAPDIPADPGPAANPQTKTKGPLPGGADAVDFK